MKRHIAATISIVVTLSGCTTFGDTRAIATPWVAGGFHTFKPAPAAEPNAQKANAEVAQLLDNEESAEGVRVAAR